ncbi:hypothetical protein [Nocardiopsis sp. NRRL B-16309]|uniref:hypothetical protein n=1 Tax=Nocardiopsis sp. NRRL B-16309 TaxID=1519494 RepID=UPI0006AF8B80|nr:hypothetical protein [Nocardiopsis sp. NRRL B-16309]KOX23827.1 hypothetical protein ADL05_01865 [Nocardiopsis sp. NRRL B-16309]
MLRFDMAILLDTPELSDEDWSVFVYEAVRAGYDAVRDTTRELGSPVTAVGITPIPGTGITFDVEHETTHVFAALQELHAAMTRHIAGVAHVDRVDVFAAYPTTAPISRR